MDASVGPIRIEVVKGLEQVRVILEPNEWGIELDAVYDGFCEAHLESRHFDRQFSRVIFDSTRFAQVGGWTGTLKVGDREVALTPDRWWGSRDRSWGIRPVGESEPPGIRVTDTEAGFFWIYAPGALRGPRHGDHHPGAARAASGSCRTPTGVPVLGSGGEADVAGPSRARAALRAGHPDRDRAPRSPTSAPRASRRPRSRWSRCWPSPCCSGSGYGLEPDWKHGMYQGDLVIQGQIVAPRPELHRLGPDRVRRQVHLRRPGRLRHVRVRRHGPPRAVRLHRLSGRPARRPSARVGRQPGRVGPSQPVRSAHHAHSCGAGVDEVLRRTGGSTAPCAPTAGGGRARTRRSTRRPPAAAASHTTRVGPLLGRAQERAP